MNFWILLILATIQGLTEFLPVSSSGHLVVLNNLFGIESDIKLVSILLHLATLLSVLIYYRKEIVALISHPFCPTNRKIVVTTICTCGVVLILKSFIESTFSGDYIFVFFIITAMLLFIGDYIAEKREFMSRTSKFTVKDLCSSSQNILSLEISYKQAVIIGLTQGIACIPGISRSGSTIAISQICGAKDSARYSFLISIPIIIASFIMEIFEGGITLQGVSVPSLIICMVICFFVGLLSIRITTKLVNSNKLTLFGYYLLALSTILVVLSFF